MQVHYFLGSRLLGTSSRTPWWDDVQLATASVALLCPVCGEVWGRVAIEGKEWTCLRRGCAKHPYSAFEHANGSFLPSWLHRYDHLPPEVLRHELNLLLKEFPDEHASPTQPQ